MLAISLNTGISGKTVLNLAPQLLEQFAGVDGFLHPDRVTFFRVRGVGLDKYPELQAVLELNCRHLTGHLAERSSN